MMNIRHTRWNWLPLLVITALTVLFYYPVLFQHKTQIHAEGVSLGIALMHMLSSALHGDASLLWTTSIYGGHPIFAESQGGFANPLHLLLAWFFPAVPGYNIHQFLSMLLSGLGAYGMCRSASCSRAAATFAALALIYSTLWIGGRSNLAVGSTLGWIPWAFWGMNVWLQRADLYSAAFFGVSMALMVLSGYPQIVHGVVIYMAVYLAVQIASRGEPMARWPDCVRLARTGLIAILLCIGLSAVQLLPLLELAGESHRSDGVSIIAIDNAPFEAFLRGFLYAFSGSEELPAAKMGSAAVYFDAMGSLLVCLVFSLLVFFRTNARAGGHLLATLFLVILGMGTGGSPVFQLLYDYHLIPGLHSFRVAFTYLYVALVGFSILCAFSLDQLARVDLPAMKARLARVTLSRRMLSMLLPAAWVAVWLIAIAFLHVDEVGIERYYSAIAWVICCSGLLVSGLQRFLPVIAVLILSVEIIIFKADSFNYGESSLIAKPASIQVLERTPGLEDFKFDDKTYAAAYSFLPPKSPAVVRGLKIMLASATPASNALWGVSSLRGNTALGLKRRALADPVIDAELRPGNNRIPGLRLIDFVSLKYLAVMQKFNQPGFIEAYSDSELPVRIVENTHAYPRFQFFDESIIVPTPEAAVEAVEGLRSRALVIEAADAPALVAAPSEGQAAPELRLLQDSPDLYEFEIRTAAPVWFFVADPNYPGWRAWLDGDKVPLYSAQVLGKAVLIPAGEHVLKLAFEPLSFRVGLAVTSLSLLLVLSIVVRKFILRARGGSGEAAAGK